MITVLHDGWALVREPGSPAAAHLLAHLQVSTKKVRNLVALPGQLADPIPDGVETIVVPTRRSSFAHLVWVQRVVPALRRKHAADLVHATQALPFGAGKGYIYSPAWKWPGDSPAGTEPQTTNIWERMLEASTYGSASQVEGVLWPEDIPLPGKVGRDNVRLLPSFTYSMYNSGSDQKTGVSDNQELEDNFVLYGGPTGESDLVRLLASWRWAAEAVGQDTYLAVLAENEHIEKRIREMLAGTEMLATIRILRSQSLAQITHLFSKTRAVFHPALVTIWGNPVRYALACGKPIAAAETGYTAAITGPAAYLAPIEDTRALGAALLTILVEESIEEKLVSEAQKRVKQWRNDEISQQITEVYAELVR